MAEEKRCTWPDCERGGRIRLGLCGFHYGRLRRGVPLDAPLRQTAKGVTCASIECDEPAVARGLCTLHWQRARNGVDMGRPLAIATGALCTADGCEKLGRKRGLCSKHYTRLVKHGSVDADYRRPRRTCSVNSCDRPSHAQGMCIPHSRRAKAGKPLDAPLRLVGRRVPCATPGCDGEATPNVGLCRRCHDRSRYAANPEQFKARVTLRRSRSELGDEDRAISLEYRLAIADDPCAYCGSATLSSEVDHIFPLALGGTDHWWNLTQACKPCNRQKYAHCGTWWNLRRGSWVEADAVA